VSPTAESSRRRSGRLSYRLSLVVVIPLLVLLTGGVNAVLSYLASQDSIAVLAKSSFEKDADLVADQARAHLHQAPPAVDTLVGLLRADDAPVRPDDVARRLLAVMLANPTFTYATYSKPDGSFVGVHRASPESPVRVNESQVVDGKTHMVERTVVSEAEWTPFRKDDDYGYDPRNRPFYARAVAAKRRVWIEPYVFYDAGIPGITCAAPIYEADGGLRGVVTVDFDLNVLSGFVASVHASGHEQAFVYVRDGPILAHPALHLVIKSGQRGDGRLMTKDDVADPVLREYFKEKKKASFEFEGATYFAATREFEPDPGLRWSVGIFAPESDFMGGLPRATLESGLVSFLALLVAGAIAVGFATKMAAPLAYLSTEMDRVGRFELDSTDPPGSIFREIQLMNVALAAMKVGLRSFASYVPREVVRAMLAAGRDAVLGGETKELTVFFSDLAGFTSLSEKMTPSDLVLMLGIYFDEMTRVISDHGGTVDKFIGDAIMAFWNAPADDPTHAEHASLAAFACDRRLEELKKEDPRLEALSARIGVATGDVIVGNIGSHQRLNYTAIGDTVNLASRLEGLSKVYGTRVLVSESTYLAAKHAVVMRPVDVVTVKGKSRAVRVYEPIALVSEGNASAVERADTATVALDAYLGRRFREAVSCYERMLVSIPSDRAAREMMRRAAEYVETPPPDAWDGAAVMTEK
jgi:adenylate cyclase